MLGPKLYFLFSKPVEAICHQHKKLYRLYVDYTQLYMIIRPLEDFNDYFSRLEASINNYGSWVTSNPLKLNQDKTELITFTTRKHQKYLPKFQLKVGDYVIEGERRCNFRLISYFGQVSILDRQVVSFSDMLPHK